MAVPRPMTDASGSQGSAVNNGTRQLLTFSLGDEVYAVDILRLKEIRGWSPVTRLPHSPDFLLGVLNLRGIIVPVVDLRVRFGMAPTEFSALTVIIVMSLGEGADRREFGIVVDKVMDVVDVTPDQVRPAPDTGSNATREAIAGIATHDDQMLILLKAEHLGFGVTTPEAVPNAA
ncbi:MAG TPA: chemotaxis protein CheW [Steroidobacteraceae bacterium]|nr:chemotaxis protein CheW [Steroidobacteraceae bacterium]